jgi:hypothetical protein
MLDVSRTTLSGVVNQAYSYVHAHAMMIFEPVEFGKNIRPGDAEQYYDSYKRLSISAALAIVSAKVHATLPSAIPAPENIDWPSVSFVVFGIIIWVLLYGIALAIFFMYCGIENHSLQTAVSFWLNWWSCLALLLCVNLPATLVINPYTDKLLGWTWMGALFISLAYIAIFVPCKWIKGMVLNGKLRHGIGASYVFMIGVFFVFSKEGDSLTAIRDYFSPIFEYLP